MDAMPGESDSNEGGATRIAPPPIMDDEHIITLEPDPITPVDDVLRDTRPTPKQKFNPTQTLPGIIPPKKKR
jgi:hypothetical protein